MSRRRGSPSARITGFLLLALAALVACTTEQKPTAATGATHTDAFGRLITARCAPAAGVRGATHCTGVEYSPAPGSDGGASTVVGWGANDLESAYGILTLVPTSDVVGILVGNYNPNLEADLQVYRAQYGLPVCTTANGCLTYVDPQGGKAFPPPSYADVAESSLDVQVASAGCPNCKLVVVVASPDAARGPTLEELGTAATRAVAQGATILATAYGTPELDENGQAWAADEQKAFAKITVGLMAAAGGSGFADGSSPSSSVLLPAAFPTVTAVGGTLLTPVPDNNVVRPWTETAWPGGGSGCSQTVPKPSWQSDTICPMRTVADVSASADAALVYFSYVDPATSDQPGWHAEGGTGESAALVAAAFGATGKTSSASVPSVSYISSVYFDDVTAGSNGSCPAGSGLCNATAGYDAPTGNGSPNGSELNGDAVVVFPASGNFVNAGQSSGFIVETNGYWAQSCTSLGVTFHGLPQGVSVSVTANPPSKNYGTPGNLSDIVKLYATLTAPLEQGALVQIEATCNGVTHVGSTYLDVDPCQPIKCFDGTVQTACGTGADTCGGTFNCPAKCQGDDVCEGHSCVCPPKICPVVPP